MKFYENKMFTMSSGNTSII